MTDDPYEQGRRALKAADNPYWENWPEEVSEEEKVAARRWVDGYVAGLKDREVGIPDVEILLAYKKELEAGGRIFWCNSHERMAQSERGCEPKLGGILLGCEVVELTGIAEVKEEGTK